MGHDPPPGYPVSSYCTSCGVDFTGDWLFDKHRVGRHEYMLSEGLRLDPPREDGRRCLDRDEMRALGWRPLTQAELLASPRQRRRAGFDQELWFSPGDDKRKRASFAALDAAGASPKPLNDPRAPR
ncbi:MAG TPA: hypothetical protein VH279_07175 [Solirubrobacteraceae bacterium]|jgi:hypothetical protein|nr:hypothetical protein [Solirubrobacteraceae bacterium]